MNRKVSLVIGTLIIAAMVIAIPIVGNEGEHVDVTLESLEARLLDASIDVQKAEEVLSQAKSKWDNAEADKAKGGSSIIETDKNKKYYPLEGEMDYEFATWELESTQESIVVDGIKDYFDYLFVVEEIKVQQNKVTRLEKALDAVNKKIELGTATLSNKTAADLELQKASLALTELIHKRDQLFLDLNLLMNQDLDTTLVIQDVEVPFEEYTLESLDDHIEYVLVTNGDLEKLNYQLELSEIEKDIYDDRNSSDQYDSNLRTVRAAITDYEYQIEEKKLSLEYDVRSKYNNLLSSYDAFVIDELELENLQLELDIMTKRFEVGLQTQSDVDLAQENLDFAKLDYEKAKLDYYVAVQEYKNFID